MLRRPTCFSLILSVTLFLTINASAQNTGDNFMDGSNPALIKSHVLLDIGSYIYLQPARFYSAGIGFFYGLNNERHGMSIVVPFVHSVYDADFRGFENTVGIGDIRMKYIGAFHLDKTLGLTRVSPYLEVSAPTGEYLLGRGTGTWMYMPGVILSYALHPNVSFYPQVEFQFSGKEANSFAGANGTPDLQDQIKDNQLQNLDIKLPVVLRLESVHAWLTVKPHYIQSFSEKEYFIFFTTEAGAMLGRKTSANLSISKFVGGLPRINIIFQARLQFFL